MYIVHLAILTCSKMLILIIYSNHLIIYNFQNVVHFYKTAANLSAQGEGGDQGYKRAVMTVELSLGS